MAFVGLGVGMGWVQAMMHDAHMSKAIQSGAGGDEGPRVDTNQDDFLVVRTVKGAVQPSQLDEMVLAAGEHDVCHDDPTAHRLELSLLSGCFAAHGK
ncbi:hypothetical protein T484DRAFT_1785166, partial [Baffinella frigidus]